MALISGRKRKLIRKISFLKKAEEKASDQVDIFLGTKKWYKKPSRANLKHRAQKLVKQSEPKKAIAKSIDCLNLRPCCRKKLFESNLKTVGDLVNTSIGHLVNYYGFSDEQIQEIKAQLNRLEPSPW